MQGVVEVLSAIPYNYNDVYLHTDASLMPHIRATWASWNFLGRSQSSADAAVCCTYWINRLQRLPAHAPDTFVTLNPLHPPAAEKTIRRLQMSHPQFSFESQQAQQRLEAVQVRPALPWGQTASCAAGTLESLLPHLRTGCMQALAWLLPPEELGHKQPSSQLVLASSSCTMAVLPSQEAFLSAGPGPGVLCRRLVWLRLP